MISQYHIYYNYIIYCCLLLHSQKQKNNALLSAAIWYIYTIVKLMFCCIHTHICIPVWYMVQCTHVVYEVCRQKEVEATYSRCQTRTTCDRNSWSSESPSQLEKSSSSQLKGETRKTTTPNFREPCLKAGSQEFLLLFKSLSLQKILPSQSK